ncbi:MAG: YjbQ family protein [archaeon]|nr:MAG: YjbQ family protein [archaeon]
MEVLDRELKLHLEKPLTSVKSIFEELVREEGLKEANLVLWVPHEVSSLVQIGWEDGLMEDLEDFLEDSVPKNKWVKHDEPDTPFRHNFFEHMRSKLAGSVSLTIMVKDGRLCLGKYQDIYFYSPVYKHIPEQKILCRIMKFE